MKEPELLMKLSTPIMSQAMSMMTNCMKHFQFVMLIIFLPIVCPNDKHDSGICNSHCTCSPMSQNNEEFLVKCLNLTVVPQDIPQATSELLLSHSSITVFNMANLSPFTTLRKVFLNHCDIQTFISPSEHSSQFLRMEVLDLSHNILSDIPAFLPASLTTLILTHNTISQINYPESLHHLHNLKELFLDHNKLEVLSFSSFHNKDSLTGLTNLEKLALNGNQIGTITPNTFIGFSRLSALSLAENVLEHLEGNLFLGLKNIRHLDLSNNQLQFISDDTFHGMPQLKYLNLNHNVIKVFPRIPPLIEWFDLSHNLIQVITEDFKPDIYPIEVLNIAHNPFNCNCKMTWLKQLYERREYVLKHIDVEPKQFVPTCTLPPRLAGKRWNKLKDDDFKCGEDDQDIAHGPALGSGDLAIDTRIGTVTDTSLQVLWKSDSPGFSLANVHIQYYAFGLRDATMKHIEIAAAQQGYVIKNLRPSTNYVVCIRPRKVTNGNSLNTPLSLNDCKEIATKEPKPPPLASRLEVIFYYVLGMLATFIGIFVFIGVFAMLYGLWHSKNTHWSSKYVADDTYIEDSTYQTDEPITKKKKVPTATLR